MKSFFMEKGTLLSYMIKNLAADDVVMGVARASAAMDLVLMKCAWFNTKRVDNGHIFTVDIFSKLITAVAHFSNHPCNMPLSY